MSETDKPLSVHTDYVEWLESNDRKRARNWAVTYEIRNVKREAISLQCAVLQWEDSNAKWYKHEPYEGRIEVGCYFDLWLTILCGDAPEHASGNARIVQVRPI